MSFRLHATQSMGKDVVITVTIMMVVMMVMMVVVVVVAAAWRCWATLPSRARGDAELNWRRLLSATDHCCDEETVRVLARTPIIYVILSPLCPLIRMGSCAVWVDRPRVGLDKLSKWRTSSLVPLALGIPVELNWAV